jgi:hypothetical protein
MKLDIKYIESFNLFFIHNLVNPWFLLLNYDVLDRLFLQCNSFIVSLRKFHEFRSPIFQITCTIFDRLFLRRRWIERGAITGCMMKGGWQGAFQHQEDGKELKKPCTTLKTSNENPNLANNFIDKNEFIWLQHTPYATPTMSSPFRCKVDTIECFRGCYH